MVDWNNMFKDEKKNCGNYRRIRLNIAAYQNKLKNNNQQTGIHNRLILRRASTLQKKMSIPFGYNLSTKTDKSI